MSELIVLVVLIFLLLFINAISKRGEFKLLKNISANFEEADVKLFYGPRLRGKYKGFNFSISIFPWPIANENYDLKLIRLRINLYLKKYSRFRFAIYNKAPGFILFLKRVKILNDNFNKNYYVFSNLPIEASQYFYVEKYQTIVKKLMEEEWSDVSPSHLIISRKKITFRKPINPNDLNYKLLRDKIEEMCDLIIEEW